MSTIVVNGIQTSGGIDLYTAKAWCNFDGITPTVTASQNMTSITDNGTGDYTINFENSFSSTAYVCAGKGGLDSIYQFYDCTWSDTSTFTTSAFQIYTGYRDPDQRYAADTYLHAAFIN